MKKERSKLGHFLASTDVGIFSNLARLDLVDRKWVRWGLEKMISGIEVKEIPPILNGGAVLASNYPSVSETMRAWIKIACLLPGDRLRLKGIARETIIAQKSSFLSGFIAAGIIPASKGEDGSYHLSAEWTRKAIRHLQEGGVLALSPTGSTEGNGLLIKSLRPGAVIFAMKCQVPIVPMGLVTQTIRGKDKVVEINFGSPILVSPPKSEDTVDQLSLFVLRKIADLLPYGQRGDFEKR